VEGRRTVRPFDGCNNEVAALFASGFLAHAGEELIVEPGDLVALMARTAAGELTVETLAAFLRNARKA
jgi:prophage maintenance system killer protein